MTARTGSLVREIAGLFTKYSLADWQPLIQELSEAGPRNERLANSIKEYIDIATARNRALKKTRSKPVRKTSKSQESPANYGKLAPLRAALLNREVFAVGSPGTELEFAL